MWPGRALGSRLVQRLRTACGLGLGLGLVMGATVRPGVAGPRDEEVRAGDHVLRIQVLHAGTRSEGRIGRLFIGGKERHGGAVGEFIDVATAGGTVRFIYLGQARPHLWSVSGWQASPMPAATKPAP